MKKIIALVLALVMTLSLLPMNVWAEGEEQTEPQKLYWMRENWTSEKYVIDKGNTDHLRVSIDGENFLAYGANELEVSVTSGLGDVTLASGFENGTEVTLIKWEATDASEGEGSISLTVDGTVYSLPVFVNLAPLWMGDKNNDRERRNETTVVGGKSYNWELWIEKWDQNGKSTPTITEEAFTVSTDNQTYADMVSFTGNTVTFDATSLTSGEHSFTLIATDKTTNISYHFRVRVTDPSNVSDLFCRAVWGSNKDGWESGRFGGQAGEQMTLEFALPPENGGRPADDDSAMMSLEEAMVTVSENLGTATISGNQVLWDCTTLIPGSKGVLKITAKGGTCYNIPVEITPSLVSVYSDEPDYDNLGESYMVFGQNRFYTYTPGASESQVFYLLAREGAEFNGTPDQWPDGFAIVENSNGRLATYTIPAGSYGRKDFTIKVLQTWDGGSQENDWWIGFAEEERYSAVVDENGMTTDDKNYGLVPIGDTGYFIAPVGYLYGEIRVLGGGWQSFHEDGQTESVIAVGFCKLAPDGVTYELLEGAELATVAARFNDAVGNTTLKMDIKLAGESNTENTRYPLDRPISQTNDVEYYKVFVSPNAYPLAKIYQFNKNSRGVWIFELTGTYTDENGKTVAVTAYGRDEKRTEKQDSVQIPAQSTPEETVAYINNFLQEYEGSSSEYNAIHLDIGLPAGELKGYIEVPAKNYNVFFYGAMDDDGNILTTLEGGIIANNADTRATNVQFVGAGRGEKDWSKAETWNSSKLPNKAIYGKAGGGVYHCSFIGYECAIEMNGGVIGAGGNTDYNGVPVGDTGCFFYNNEVAIKVNLANETDFMGDSQYWKMVMVNNGTDIDFASTCGEVGYWVDINSAIFVRNDNKNSIHNTGGRTFFMPMLAFANSKNDSNNGNHDPKVDGNVSIAPYYTLTAAGKDALITNLNVEAMLDNPTYKEEWVSQERSFPRKWICPANPDKEIYSVSSDEITEEEMTIDIVDNNNGDEYVGTIKLKKNNK